MFAKHKKACAVLTSILLLTSIATATTVDYRLDENQNVIISGSVGSAVGGKKVYIQVLNQGSDKENLLSVEDLTALNYKQLISQSVIVTTNADGKFGYTYKLPNNASYYKIRANDGSGIAEKQFYFVSHQRRQEVVDELKNRSLTPDPATLKTKMLSAQYADILGLEFEAFNGVKDETGATDKIFTNLFAGIVNATNADAVKEQFNLEVLAQTFNFATDTELKGLLSDVGNIELMNFDISQTVTFGTLSDTAEGVFYVNLVEAPIDGATTLVSKIKEVLFLTAIEKATSWEDINPVIEENKGMLDFDYARYNTHANRNRIDVALVGNKYTLVTLGDAIDTLSAASVNGDTGGSGNGGSGGSSGGGGGGASAGGGAGVAIPDTSHIQESVVSDNKAETVEKFKDVSSHWAKAYIETLYNLGVVNGVSDIEFAPDSNVKREEFIKMLVNLFGFDAESGEVYEFSDVPAEHWSYSYVATAKKYGIVQGYEGNKFGLEQDITREDMLVLLNRVCKMRNIEMFTVNEDISFSDYSSVSDYAKEAVLTLSQKGVISGYSDGTFKGKNPATRGETAKILSAFVDYVD